MCSPFVRIVHGHIYKTARRDLLKHIVQNKAPQMRGGDTPEPEHNESRDTKTSGGGFLFAPVFIHFFNIPLQVLLQRDGHCATLNGRL